jgi:hypothetical protein
MEAFMAYSITPSLGADIDYVGGVPYWDNANTKPSPAIGTVVKGSDGHDYVFAKASAAVASAAVVVLTEPAMTFATGSGAWTAPTITGGVPSGGYAWLQKTAI